MKPIRNKGFTLIELSVVLLIIGIAAAVVALRMDGPLRRAEMADVIGEIRRFDHLSREYAKEHDKRLLLTFDLTDGKLSRTDEDMADVGEPVVLPDGFYISRMAVGKDDVGSGIMTIGCSEQGFTQSYALLVGHTSGRRQWLVFAGMTGNVLEPDNDKDNEEIEEIQKIFASTGRRPDAD